LLCGCRCSESGPPRDLLQLVPARADLVVSVDLVTLRRSDVMAKLFKGRKKPGPSGSADRPSFRALGFDPARDLDRVVLAAGGEGGRLEFLVLITGRLDRQRVLDALDRRARGKLTHRSHQGHTLYEDGTGNTLLFLGRSSMVVVSRGWSDLVLARLRGQGRSVLGGNRQLAGDIRAVRGSHPAWLVSRLAPAMGRYLAHRLEVTELQQLRSVEGNLRAAAGQLQLRLALRLDGEGGARSLEGRLARVQSRRLSPSAARRLRVERKGRRVVLRLTLTVAQIQEILDHLGQGGQGGGG